MLEKSILIALIVVSFHVMIDWPGMIFHGIADWSARKKMPLWFEKPVFACPICMVPYYGSFFYILCMWSSWREWAVVIFAAMGINTILVKLKLV
jgi:hypothetical protein